MRIIVPVAATFAALLLASAAGAAEASPNYLLAMELRDGGKLVGSPVLQIKSGETATVEIDDGAGHRYALRVTATPQDANTVHVQSSVEVASGTARYSGNPALIVKLGQRSAIELGGDTGSIRIDLKVSPVQAN